MKVTLTELYQGLPLYRKGVRYNSTKDYVKPFLDKFKEIDYILKIDVQQGPIKYEYDRVLVQVILNYKSEIKNCICLSYCLDTLYPTFKIYQQYIYNDMIICNKDTVVYICNTNNIHYNIVDAFKKFKPLDISVYDFSIKRKNVIHSIGDWMLKCSNLTFELNDNVLISLSYNIYTKIIKYIKDNIKEEYSFKELYIELQNEIIKQKDIDNRFEKFCILNKSFI